jgi:hypothetical protein
MSKCMEIKNANKVCFKKLYNKAHVCVCVCVCDDISVLHGRLPL